MIKIPALFPEGDKDFLQEVFHHRNISYILVGKGRKGMKEVMKDLVEGLLLSFPDLPDDILLQSVILFGI